MDQQTREQNKALKKLLRTFGSGPLKNIWNIAGLLGRSGTTSGGVPDNVRFFVTKREKTRNARTPYVIGLGCYKNNIHVTPYLDIFGLGRIRVNGGAGRGEGRVVTYRPDGNIKTRAWDDFHIHHMDEKIYAKAVELQNDHGGDVWRIAYVLKNCTDQSDTGGNLLDILKDNGAFLNPDGVEQMGKDNQYADAPSENAPKCEGQIHQQLLNVGLTKIGKEHGCLDGQSFGNCGIWGFSKVFVYFILFDELNKKYRTLQERRSLSNSEIFKKATNGDYIHWGSDYVDDVWKKAKSKVKEFWGELMEEKLKIFFANPAHQEYGKDRLEMLNTCVSCPTLCNTLTNVYYRERNPTTLGAMSHHFFIKFEKIMNGSKNNSKCTKGREVFSSSGLFDLAALQSLFFLATSLDSDGANLMLASAARNNRIDIAEYLLNNGAQIDSKTTYYDRTSLYWASKDGSLELVKCLVGKGANVHEVDKEGDTPLMIAAKNGRFGVVKYLVGKGYDISKTDSRGRSPAEIATQNSHPTDVVMSLVEKAVAEIAAAAAQAAAAKKAAAAAAQAAVETAQAAVSQAAVAQAAVAQAIVENNARFRFRVAITFAIVAVAVVSVPLGLGVGLVAAIPFVVAGCLLGRVGQNTKKTQNKHNRGATTLLDNKLGKKIESNLDGANISP